MTSPKLLAVDGDNIAALIRPKESIAYQAAGRNDIVGAPFMITGYQNWLPASNKTQAINNMPTVYAASGTRRKTVFATHCLAGYRNTAQAARQKYL